MDLVPLPKLQSEHIVTIAAYVWMPKKEKDYQLQAVIIIKNQSRKGRVVGNVHGHIHLVIKIVFE